jgi:hypothetical protein
MFGNQFGNVNSSYNSIRLHEGFITALSLYGDIFTSFVICVDENQETIQRTVKTLPDAFSSCGGLLAVMQIGVMILYHPIKKHPFG